MSVRQLSPNSLCSISTIMFPHKCVLYETRSCACSLNKRRVSAHFLTYENMFSCKIYHITPCFTSNFPLMYLKRCKTTWL